MNEYTEACHYIGVVYYSDQECITFSINLQINPVLNLVPEIFDEHPASIYIKVIQYDQINTISRTLITIYNPVIIEPITFEIKLPL